MILQRILLLMLVLIIIPLTGICDEISNTVDSYVSKHRPVDLTDDLLSGEIKKNEGPVGLKSSEKMPEIMPDLFHIKNVFSMRTETPEFEIVIFDDFIKDSLRLLPAPPEIPE